MACTWGHQVKKKTCSRQRFQNVVCTSIQNRTLHSQSQPPNFRHHSCAQRTQTPTSPEPHMARACPLVSFAPSFWQTPREAPDTGNVHGETGDRGSQWTSTVIQGTRPQVVSHGKTAWDASKVMDADGKRAISSQPKNYLYSVSGLM